MLSRTNHSRMRRLHILLLALMLAISAAAAPVLADRHMANSPVPAAYACHGGGGGGC